MILFITSAALLFWALWLYWQHVIKPVKNEQTSNNYENAKASTSLGNSTPICQTTIIDQCQHCNGTGIVQLS
jgi:hypothetical protein